MEEQKQNRRMKILMEKRKSKEEQEKRKMMLEKLDQRQKEQRKKQIAAKGDFEMICVDHYVILLC